MIINLSGNRQPVTSVDGKIGDVNTNAVTYTQQTLTAEQKEMARFNIGAGESNVLYVEMNFTLPIGTSESWVHGTFSDSTDYYQYTISRRPFNTLTSSDCVFAGLNATDAEEAHTMQNEYNKISRIEVLDGSVCVYVYGNDLPTVELPILLKVFYDAYASSGSVSDSGGTILG